MSDFVDMFDDLLMEAMNKNEKFKNLMLHNVARGVIEEKDEEFIYQLLDYYYFNAFREKPKPIDENKDTEAKSIEKKPEPVKTASINKEYTFTIDNGVVKLEKETPVPKEKKPDSKTMTKTTTEAKKSDAKSKKTDRDTICDTLTELLDEVFGLGMNF